MAKTEATPRIDQTEQPAAESAAEELRRREIVGELTLAAWRRQREREQQSVGAERRAGEDEAASAE